MPIKIDLKIIKDEIRPMLVELKRRMGDLSPLMKNVGEMALTSIRKNFEVGGRPSKWPGLKLSTIKQRTAQGHWPGKILIRHGVSGGLLGTVSYRAESDRVVLSANKVYAAIQHFSGQAGRGHKVTIPARPYMLVQPEDWAEIKRLAGEYLTKA
jgi:phage virion morphogenesis protein